MPAASTPNGSSVRWWSKSALPGSTRRRQRVPAPMAIAPLANVCDEGCSCVFDENTGTPSSEISRPTSVPAGRMRSKNWSFVSTPAMTPANGPRWPIGTNTTKPRPPTLRVMAGVITGWPLSRARSNAARRSGVALTLVPTTRSWPAIGSTHRMMPSASTQTSAR